MMKSKSIERVDELPSIIEVQLNMLGLPYEIQDPYRKYKPKRKGVRDENVKQKSLDKNGEPLF